MNCMKCSREIEGEGAFCQDCLLEMEKYPVQPGTVVLLPRRKENSFQKKTVKRHVPSPEEQITTLQRQIRLLFLLLVLCFVAIGIMFKPAMHYIRDEHIPIGQNYSTVTPANNPAPTD